MVKMRASSLGRQRPAHRLLAALLLFPVLPGHAQSRLPTDGTPAPDFSLERLDGGRMALSELRGRPVLLNFWATWCAPCRAELPALMSAYETHRAAGLEVVAVNLADQERGKDVRRFAAELGLPFPVVLDQKGKVRKRYRLVALPTTVFVDTAGIVRATHAGPISSTALTQGLEQILPRDSRGFHAQQRH
jgi:cytochrome c biogenesis protein CcmG, thiol:disulfide interchange protein DsbE